MNDELKNIFSFIKEALELKNKNIYLVNNYEIHLDLGKFCQEFEINYNNLNLDINSDDIVFQLRYVDEKRKEAIPKVPNVLQNYILLNNKNEIVSQIDNLEKTLDENGLIENYKEYFNELENVKSKNKKIDDYNKVYMMFYNVYKRINDSEEKIEVILGKKLLVWKNEEKIDLERYILEANLDISIDSIDNVIYFKINKDKFRGFVTDFLNNKLYKIKDVNILNEFVKEFNNNIDNIDSNEVDWNLEARKYINYASLNNEIIRKEFNNEQLKSQMTYLFDNCAIIVRNKNIKLWIEDLEKIISLCDDTKFQSPILNLFQIDFNNSNDVLNLLNDKNYEITKNDEVLFPLPSNEEQYKIVDKVKSSNIVLVQGPPGTGKSHTIANLISHYISEGKKVIVTSEKAKALEVLREKLPKAIRSLSLALLTSSGVDKDLEYSVNNVLDHQEEATESELTRIENEIAKLKEKLKENHLEKQKVMKKILDLMASDTISHKEELKNIINYENTSNWNLMDIAIFLSKNREYNLIPISDSENYLYPNARDFFLKLDDICDDIKNNSYALSRRIPINDYFNNNEIELYIKERKAYQNYQIQNPSLENAIKMSNLNENSINNLNLNIQKLDILYKYFSKEEVKIKILHEPFINKVREILELIKTNTDYVLIIEKNLYDYKVTFKDESKITYYKQIISELLSLYDDKGVIHLFDKIKFNSYLKELNGLLYNERVILKDNITKNDVIKIKEAIEYYELIDIIKNRLNQVLNIDLFMKINIPKNQFSSFSNEIINLLDAFINYNEYSKKIDEEFKNIINTNLFPISYVSNDNEYIKSVIEDLKYYIIEKSKFTESNLLINKIREYYKDYNLKKLENVLIAIAENKLDNYIESKNLLLKEINIINQYNGLKESYPNLVQEKSNLINNYIYKFQSDEKQKLKDNLDFVFKYHYVEKYYLLLQSKDISLSELYDYREKLIKEEKEIVVSLVEKKGWYYQNKRMIANPNLGASLRKWVNLKKRLGGGTGKNANIYLRQMREEMQSSRDAIPVWIMPIDKLIEQYPFSNNPPFDVLIMDESSQTSVFSLSALTRASKIIIVGDDKQISPSDAFSKIDNINSLRTKYLKNNSWELQFSKDMSVYDIVQTVCGPRKITLTEHFRCLPEIIHYSNKEFYNMMINPLKVRGKENTIEKPIKTVYVQNAICEKIDNQVYNQKEVDTIVELIEKINNDEQYLNKTIGIIALQSGSKKYIQKLTELIMQKFGEKFVKERKIKIGTTYDFQGDERDVIILGMVVASILENGTPYRFKSLTTDEFNKSYNVAASRAREQMILVHSVTLQELSPSCNRYKLLSYCLNYDNEKVKEDEKLFESNFERDVYKCLAPKYKLIPQFKVGRYRIDFVLIAKDQKIAIECDGDKYHGIDELGYDLERQTILERCGWKFVRIRASEFYYNKEKSMNALMEQIEDYLSGNNMISYSNSNHNSIPNDLFKIKDVEEVKTFEPPIPLKKEKDIEELLGFSD